MHAAGHAGGGAQAAERVAEGLRELGGAGLQLQALDERVLLGLVAHRDLELLRGRRELNLEHVAQREHEPLALLQRAAEDLVERGELAQGLALAVGLDPLADLRVDALHHRVQHGQGLQQVAHAGVHRQELGVDARREAVAPLAHRAADAGGAAAGVDEHVGRLARVGGELLVEDGGDALAELLVGVGVVLERAPVGGAGQQRDQLLHDNVGLGLGVDLHADLDERPRHAADGALLRARREGALVLAQALGGVGGLVAAEEAASCGLGGSAFHHRGAGDADGGANGGGGRVREVLPPRATLLFNQSAIGALAASGHAPASGVPHRIAAEKRAGPNNPPGRRQFRAPIYRPQALGPTDVKQEEGPAHALLPHLPVDRPAGPRLRRGHPRDVPRGAPGARRAPPRRHLPVPPRQQVPRAHRQSRLQRQRRQGD